MRGGRDRDRTCDPYHVKVVLILPLLTHEIAYSCSAFVRQAVADLLDSKSSRLLPRTLPDRDFVAAGNELSGGAPEEIRTPDPPAFGEDFGIDLLIAADAGAAVADLARVFAGIGEKV